MLSGLIEDPILEADCIIAENGKISAIGREKDLNTDGATTTVDAHGVTLAPGLIDSHIHPVVGDYTPRQQQLHWIDSTLHGGVTTLISAGEVHMPGRPRDVVGLKAMAIASQALVRKFPPHGVKVHAGAPVIEHGMVEQDFKDLADAGVKLLGEVGLGTVKDGTTGKQMVDWARKYGIQSTIHTGGPSIPGSGLVMPTWCWKPGPTWSAISTAAIRRCPTIRSSACAKAAKRPSRSSTTATNVPAILTLNTARELGKLDQVILGTDGPAGSGVQPLGILRMVALLSSMGGAPAEQANLFRHRQHRAANGSWTPAGLRSACAPIFVLMDQAQHAPGKDILESIQLGNLPGVGMTVIDGKATSQRSRNTPPAQRLPEIIVG